MTEERLAEKLELYVLSLWFLFLLIIVVTVDVPLCLGSACTFIGWTALLERNWIPLIASLFLFAGAVFYARFDHRISGSGSLPVQISDVEDINYEHLTFLTTYIIPLICFNLTSTRYLIALAMLLVVIGFIYVKTDKFYVNPTLALLGFRLYSARLAMRNGEIVQATLISKDRLSNNDLIRHVGLDKKVFYVRRTG